MHFILTIPVFNSADSIGATIASVLAQSYPHWVCFIMDDRSTDGTAEAADRAAGGDPRIRVVRNQEKKYALRNIAEAIELAGPSPADVVVCLDGDDRLAHPGVLQRLVMAYEREGAWMTYGSYIGPDNQRGRDAVAYPAVVHALRCYRRAAWRASHLKTFAVWLWRQIDPADLGLTVAQMRAFCRRRLFTGFIRSWWQLRNVPYEHLVEPSGRYFRRCVDKAMMFPMLEMAGTRAVFIPDILYIYARHRPENPHATAEPRSPRHSNRFIRLYLMRQPRYPRLAEAAAT